MRAGWLPSFVAASVATTGAFLAWRAGGANEARAGAPAASARSAVATPARHAEGAEGEGITLRLIDALKDARYDAPSFRAGLAALDSHWRKMQAPWTGLMGTAAKAAMSYALLTSDEEKEYTVPLANGDVWKPDARQWNMAEGSFDQRNAIFAPTPATIAYRLDVPLAATLELSVTTDNAPGDVAFAVHVKDARGADREVWTRTLGRHDTKKWIEARVDLAAYGGQNVELSLTTRVDHNAIGVPALALWGNPVVLSRQPTRVPYNVLWIVVDATRADAVASFHDAAEDAAKLAAPLPPLEALLPRVAALTPSLDELTRRGARFTHAYSAASWTRPGTAAMLGGARSTELGLDSLHWQLPDAEVAHFYASDPPMLPLLLRRQGVVTRAFVNNYFMVGYAAVGADMGFDAIDDYRFRTKDTGEITTHAIDWLKSHKDERFFVFCNYNSPHEPLDPPARFLAKVPPPPLGPKDPEIAKYMAEVGKDDEAIGMLTHALDELGLRERTIVIMTADHGETLSSVHNGTSGLDHMKVRFHHSASNFEETTHVPIVLSLPGKIAEGVAVTPRVRTIDLAPTVLDLEGLEPSPKMTGKSLVPLTRGEAEADPRVVLSEGRGTHGLIVGDYRLLTREGKAETLIFGDEEKKVPEELFNLTTDPGERKNLLRAEPDKAAELRARLDAALHEVPVTGTAASHIAGGASPDVTTVTLRFAGHGEPHRVTGAVWVDPGSTLQVKPVGQNPESVRGESPRVVLALQTPRDTVTGVDLLVSPPGGVVHWQLFVDDRKLEASQVFGGPFGLGAPGLVSGIVSDDDRVSAFATKPADIDPARDLGLFVTRERGSEPEAVERAKGAAGAEEMQRLMREWGYAHDKGTKGH